VNFGGFLLLTLIFSVLMLVVQRSERKRRVVSLIIMLIVGGVIWRYGLYVMGRDCALQWQALCRNLIFDQKLDLIARQTLTAALAAALLVNLSYWALFGRYNPVGSSDSIKVIGMYD
jgi:biotin transporter BioY